MYVLSLELQVFEFKALWATSANSETDWNIRAMCDELSTIWQAETIALGEMQHLNHWMKREQGDSLWHVAKRSSRCYHFAFAGQACGILAIYQAKRGYLLHQWILFRGQSINRLTSDICSQPFWSFHETPSKGIAIKNIFGRLVTVVELLGIVFVSRSALHCSFANVQPIRVWTSYLSKICWDKHQGQNQLPSMAFLHFARVIFILKSRYSVLQSQFITSYGLYSTVRWLYSNPTSYTFCSPASHHWWLSDPTSPDWCIHNCHMPQAVEHKMGISIPQ